MPNPKCIYQDLLRIPVISCKRSCQQITSEIDAGNMKDMKVKYSWQLYELYELITLIMCAHDRTVICPDCLHDVSLSHVLKLLFLDSDAVHSRCMKT